MIKKQVFNEKMRGFTIECYYHFNIWKVMLKNIIIFKENTEGDLPQSCNNI